MNPYAVSGVAFGVTALGLVAAKPLSKWYRKVHRRKGGIYLWRVDHHMYRWRRVNGYVGETVSYHFRTQQHLGSTWYRVDGTRGMAPRRAAAQPWSDLNPHMYRVLPLPWWLCWKWILKPLETLFILALWPRYNVAKNRWNPLRIDRGTALRNRAARDAGRGTYHVKVWSAHLVRTFAQVAGALLVLAGLLGWMAAR